MKFSIDYNNYNERSVLVYNAEEYSFVTEPMVQEINFDAVLNKLNLTAVDDDNKIIQIWGFCGYKEWIKADYEIPQFVKGTLKVIDDLEFGYSYMINKEEQPIYTNTKTGWICIGNPKKNGNAVEFINNCIAVIGDDKELVSLWLKPNYIGNVIIGDMLWN